MATLVTRKVCCPACGGKMPVANFGLDRDGNVVSEEPVEHELGIASQYSAGDRKFIWQLDAASPDVLRIVQRQLMHALKRVADALDAH